MVLDPTMAAYVSLRDMERARTAEWLEPYALRSMLHAAGEPCANDDSDRKIGHRLPITITTGIIVSPML
jgi:hypothetical protein